MPWSKILHHLCALTFQAKMEIALLQRHGAIASSACTEVASGEYRLSHARDLELEMFQYSGSVGPAPYECAPVRTTMLFPLAG